MGNQEVYVLEFPARVGNDFGGRFTHADDGIAKDLSPVHVDLAVDLGRHVAFTTES